MADNNERTPLLKVEHLSKEFPAESGMFAKRFSKRVVSAVNDISLRFILARPLVWLASLVAVNPPRAALSCV